jgi:hypothetical protein
MYIIICDKSPLVRGIYLLYVITYQQIQYMVAE